jgi:hypothetical protein
MGDQAVERAATRRGALVAGKGHDDGRGAGFLAGQVGFCRSFRQEEGPPAGGAAGGGDGRVPLKIIYLIARLVAALAVLVFAGSWPRRLNCWCSGTRTRCCTGTPGEYGTSPPTDCGSGDCHIANPLTRRAFRSSMTEAADPEFSCCGENPARPGVGGPAGATGPVSPPWACGFGGRQPCFTQWESRTA